MDLTKLTREEGQHVVVDVYDRKRFLMIEYCTGFGKGKASLTAIARVIKRETRKTRGIIIVHSTNARKRDWPTEIKQWFPDLLEIAEVYICHYSVLKTLNGIVFDWVIADEAHYITPANYPFFKNNTIKSLILMTGFLPDDPIKIKMLKDLSCKNKLTITLDEAVDNHILNDYRVHIWGFEMTEMEQALYHGLCSKVDYAILTANPFNVRQKLGQRAQFLYNLNSKYQASCYIRDRIREANRRFIIFCLSVEMANKLSPYRLHGSSGAGDYSRFLNMEVNELATIKMIQEGANIKQLQTALMNQINSKALNFMQKLGRMMRLSEGQTAIVHVMCTSNTYDETWVRKATKAINQSKITWHKLDASLYNHYT